MEDLTGKQFGPYRIVAPLGEGGMAAVYRAYQPSVDRYVAIKVLPRYFASDPDFVGRFSQEAKVLARLQHPRILAVHDFGEADGYTYIVMPFVDSGSLSDLLEGDPLPMTQIAHFVSQIADALDYAHSMGVVHRDVKPSNVLVDSHGNCLLTDFGIAKMVEGTSQFTRTGGIVGTPSYMSPEQIQGRKLDGRSDVYSLGIMLYEMATGRPPFRAETPPAIFVKHLHDPLPPPHMYNPDIPEGVERVILKALAKDPDDRFSSAGELAQALTRSLAGQPVDIAGIPSIKRLPPTEAAPLPPAKRRRSILPFALIGAGVLAVLAILVILTVFVFTKKPVEPVAQQPTVPIVVPAQKPSPAPPSPTSIPTRKASPFPPTPTPVPAIAATKQIPLAEIIKDPWGQVIIPPEKPIRLAFVGPLSGDMAYLGELQRATFMMALEEAGQIYGFPLDPGASLFIDGGCTEGGEEAAQQVVADSSIVGVIGHSCSQSCRNGIPVYEEAHLVSISGSCSNPALTDQETMLFNRTVLRDDQNSDEFNRLVVESPAFVDFMDRFQQRNDLPIDDLDMMLPILAYTYDATTALLAAIRQVALIDPKGNLVIGRQALSQAVRNLRDFSGVSGEIAFDKNGDRLVPKEQGACQPGDLEIGLIVDVSSPYNANYFGSARLGLARIDQQFPVCTRYIEIHQEEQQQKLVAELASMDLDMLFAAGYDMGNASAEVATINPDLKFTILDSTIDPPLDNVQMILFRVDQASFQAGYLAAAWAALQDPSDPLVGFVGGMEIPSVEQFVVGYQSGVAFYNETKGSSVAVRGGYIGNFDQQPAAATMANELMDQGVDVIMSVAGTAGDGALFAVKDRRKWGIGVDFDQFHTLPDAQDIMLTSVVKRLDNVVIFTTRALIEGEFHGGEITEGTLANGGVDLAPFHLLENEIPETLKRELQEIRQGIIDGVIKTGW